MQDISEVIVSPLSDRVLVETIIVEKIGAIYMPEQAQGRPERARVLAVGPGGRDHNGVVHPVDLEVGDIVYFQRHTGTPISVSGEERLILREQDIVARVYDPAMDDLGD